jgi:hypothetical protein
VIINGTPSCELCGLPEIDDAGTGRIIRITWLEDSTLDHFRMRLVVAQTPKSNDVLICEGCIRGIKRLTFSDLDKSAPPFSTCDEARNEIVDIPDPPKSPEIDFDDLPF